MFSWSYKMYKPNTHENKDLGIRLQVWRINEVHMEISTWNPNSDMPKSIDIEELQWLQTWNLKMKILTQGQFGWHIAQSWLEGRRGELSRWSWRMRGNENVKWKPWKWWNGGEDFVRMEREMRENEDGERKMKWRNVMEVSHLGFYTRVNFGIITEIKCKSNPNVMLMMVKWGNEVGLTRKWGWCM